MKRPLATSGMFLILLLVECVAQSEVVPTSSLPTQTAMPAFTPTPIIIPTESISLENTPTVDPTSESLTQLPSLSLPEFNARYSTGDLALSQDRKFMAVVSNDKFNGDYSIWIWDVNDLDQSIVGYKLVVGTLWSVAFNPDGTNLAFGGTGKITILDWKMGEVLKIIELPELPNSEVAQLEFGPDNTLVFSTFKNEVSVWDLARGEVRYSVEGLTGFEPASFAISPASDVLVTGAYDGIHLRDFETGQSLGFREGPDGGIGIAPITVFSNRGNFLASTGCSEFVFEGCSSGEVFIWKSDSDTPTVISGIHPGWIKALAFSPNEEVLASVDRASVIKLIRLADGKIITAPSLEKPGQMPPKDPLHVSDIVFYPDGRVLVVSTDDGIQLLDIARMSWVPNLRFNLRLGYSYMITREGDDLNLRVEPSLRQQVITILQAGQWFTVIDGPKIADGFVWWKIRLVDDTEGWVVEMSDWYANPP